MVDEKIVGRFGEEILEPGFTAVPNLLLDCLALLGIDPLELVLLLHIWRSWWSGERFPSQSVLARRIGKSIRWVRELLRKLRERGLLARVGQEDRSWAEMVDQYVQDDVQRYCQKTYGRECDSGGYLIVVQQTSSRGQIENHYDFYPLLAYLRELVRLRIHPTGKMFPQGRDASSSSGEESFPRGSMLPPMDGTGNPPFLEMATNETVGNGKTAMPVVDSAFPSPKQNCPTMAPVLVALLDQIARFLGERQANGTEAGRPALWGYESYEAVLTALSSPISLIAVSREVSADLVEDLSVLACSLAISDYPGVMKGLEEAVGKVDMVPDLRLSALWPYMPDAERIALEMQRILWEGGRLPDGGGFRHANMLFLLLNRFTPGTGLWRQFLELCREEGVRPVHTVLKRALKDGRLIVAIAFLQKGIALLKEEKSRRERDQGPADPSDTATLEKMETLLVEYGIAEPGLSELLRMDLIYVRAWMLQLAADPELSQEFRCRLLISQVRKGGRPKSRFLRLAEALECLTLEQEEWLQEHCPRPGNPYWSGHLESVGIDPEIEYLWHEAYQH